MICSIKFMFLGILFSISVLAGENIPLNSSLNMVTGYNELSPESKVKVKTFIDKIDNCSGISLRSDSKYYPKKDWLIKKSRNNRIAVLHYHSEYNTYMCAENERQTMINTLGKGDEPDIDVLYFMYTDSVFGFISEPKIPPWFSKEDIKNIEKLTNEYRKPFGLYEAFANFYEDKVR